MGHRRCEVRARGHGDLPLVDPATGNGLSVAFFEDDVDASEVRGAISAKADQIGWQDEPRPARESETIDHG